MSYYADGRVTSDFVGLARKARQAEDTACHHVYFTGCAGNIAAGKYNDGAPANRDALADRIGTGLMLAAWEGNLPMMELLVSRGADVNKTNEVGEQALLIAAWRGRLDVVKWLLAHGARRVLLLGMPERAREWRVSKRDRNAQAALRDAMAQHFAGRYTRAQRSAQRAIDIWSATPDLAVTQDNQALAHMLAAASSHRLQDRTHRDAYLKPGDIVTLGIKGLGEQRQKVVAFKG